MVIQKQIINEIKKEVSYWEGVDFRYVGLPHMSNHLNFLIYHYSLIFPKEKWPKMIVCGNLMMRNGEKISKSKGNGTPLYRIKKEIGADLYRLYIVLSSNYDIELDFKDDEVRNLENKFLKWQDLIKKSLNFKPLKFVEYDDIDKSLISNFYKNVDTYFLEFERFKMREAFIALLYENLNQIQYTFRRNFENENKTLLAIRFFAIDFLTLMSPVVPHICEELYSYVKDNENDFISLKEIKKDYDKFINYNIIQKERIIENLLKDISRKIENFESPRKIILYSSSSSKIEIFKKTKKLIEDKKTPKEIFETLSKKFSNHSKFIPKFASKCLKTGVSFFLEKEDEKVFLQENLKFFEKEFNLKVELIDLEENKKDNNLMPGEIFNKIE